MQLNFTQMIINTIAFNADAFKLKFKAKVLSGF